MAAKKDLKNVGYYDSQGNWRSFVNNYENNSVGYTDSQGNWRGAPPTPQTNSRNTQVTTTNPTGETNQEKYNRILQERNAMLASKGLDSKGNPINGGGTSAPSNTITNTATPVSTPAPTYTKPDVMTYDYNWGDGSDLLTPDNPLVRPVVYENEFSPDSTTNIATDLYNKYYAPIVQEQQRQTTQQYNDAAVRSSAMMGAYGMSTGSSGAVQLRNQATREATAANLQYQQQMQLQAVQDTIDMRNLELPLIQN